MAVDATALTVMTYTWSPGNGGGANGGWRGQQYVSWTCAETSRSVISHSPLISHQPSPIIPPTPSRHLFPAPSRRRVGILTGSITAIKREFISTDQTTVRIFRLAVVCSSAVTAITHPLFLPVLTITQSGITRFFLSSKCALFILPLAFFFFFFFPP